MNQTTGGQLAVLYPAPKQGFLGVLGVGAPSHQIKKIWGGGGRKKKRGEKDIGKE